LLLGRLSPGKIANIHIRASVPSPFSAADLVSSMLVEPESGEGVGSGPMRLFVLGYYNVTADRATMDQSVAAAVKTYVNYPFHIAVQLQTTTPGMVTVNFVEEQSITQCIQEPLQALRRRERAGSRPQHRVRTQLPQPSVDESWSTDERTTSEISRPQIVRPVLWGTVLVFLGAILSLVYQNREKLWPNKQEMQIASSKILRVERRNTDLHVSWNQPGKAKLKGYGVLRIKDGSESRDLLLSGEELHSGQLLYTPSSNNVNFEIEIDEYGSSTVRDSIRILLASPTGRKDRDLSGRPGGERVSPQVTPLAGARDRAVVDARLTTKLENRQSKPLGGGSPEPSISTGGAAATEPVTRLNSPQPATTAVPTAGESIVRTTPVRTGTPPAESVESISIPPKEPVTASTKPAPAQPQPVQSPSVQPQSVQPQSVQSSAVTASAVEASKPPSLQITPPPDPPLKTTSPKLANRLQIIIPASIRNMLRQPVDVKVEVTVDPLGRVISSRSLSDRAGPPAYLAKLVMDSVKGRQFIPGTLNNKPVQSNVILVFQFSSATPVF
jgi:hypothetical protein